MMNVLDGVADGTNTDGEDELNQAPDEQQLEHAATTYQCGICGCAEAPSSQSELDTWEQCPNCTGWFHKGCLPEQQTYGDAVCKRCQTKASEDIAGMGDFQHYTVISCVNAVHEAASKELLPAIPIDKEAARWRAQGVLTTVSINHMHA